MEWVRPTADDLTATLSAEEVEAFGASADFADVAGAVVRRTVALVRGYVLAGGVTLPADQGLLPPALLAPAMDYAAYDLLKRLPVAVGEARRRAREDAAAVFSQVASGRMSVEPHGDSAGGGVAALPAFAAPPPARRLDP